MVWRNIKFKRKNSLWWFTVSLQRKNIADKSFNDFDNAFSFYKKINVL